MNLVVVARRPELAERCAATIQMLTGRHPSRTIVIQSADPDGPSWLDARVEAHCILPREDAPETCAETIHLTAGGEAGRHLAAIATPLIIHDLPVTVWWPGEPPLRAAAGARPAGRRGPARRRRLDLERRRAGPAARAGRARSTTTRLADQRLRARPPVALARGDRLDLRRSRTSCRTCARCAGSRSPTRRTTRPARRARPTSSSRSTTSAGWRRGWADGRQAARPRSAGPARPASARTRPGAARSSRPSGRGLAATLSDGRAEVAVVVRPVVSHDAGRARRCGSSCSPSGAARSCGPT